MIEYDHKKNLQILNSGQNEKMEILSGTEGALTPDADIGTAREAFFANQVSNGHVLTYPKKGDFLVDDRWLFEIGGKGKGFAQIKDVPDSYVVNDGVEVGIGNKIPLWLFGFLY